MSKFTNCIHGGGSSCLKHGGDGSTVHKSGFRHRFLAPSEVHRADVVPADQRIVKALPLLETEVEDTGVLFIEPIKKALYHFDLETPDGVDRLLELLPILDGEIVAEVYQEIWPGYPTDDAEEFNVRIARAEIKGYLMDFLTKHDLGPNDEKPAEVDIEDVPEPAPEDDAEEAQGSGPDEQAGEEANDGGLLNL